MTNVIASQLPIKTKKRNLYISYLKAYALLALIIIHLIDWSNIALNKYQILKELFYPSVFVFIFMVGSVVYIAYSHSQELKKPAIRLIRRGIQLIGIYFAYSLIKLFIYNFNQEPYYKVFGANFTWSNILSLRVYSVPISIILTIGILLIISPVFLIIIKKIKHPRLIMGGIFILFFIINYALILPKNFLTDFFYARGNIMFPIILWIIPYLIGILWAMGGCEKHKGKYLLILTVLMVGYYFYLPLNKFLRPSEFMYPLKPYYIIFSLFLMHLMVYVFWLLEKVSNSSNKIIKYFLSTMRLLGDSTLSVYIFHWIVVDLTMWIFFPNSQMIWITVPIFLIGFIITNLSRVKKYAAECGATKDN